MYHTKTRTFIKTCNGPFMDCMCECIRNLLKDRVPLKSKQLRSLRRYKQLIRRLPLKKTPRGERRRILQTGGLFPAILPPLISGIASLLTPAVSYMLKRHAEG
jgi:hypothetical protein